MMQAKNSPLATSLTSFVRVREGGFWLCLILLTVLLITGGIAETRGVSVAIDGVSLGCQRELVTRRLGQEVKRGSLSQNRLAWYQYCVDGEKTTVSFSAQDHCVRVRGNSLRVDDRQVGVGDSRAEVLEVLGHPARAAKRKNREVLEFDPAEGTTLHLVVEDGVLVQLSAATR